MKVTLEYLRKVCNQMAEAKVVPLPVYIAIIGDKKFMCPVSSLPDNLAPLPCEIIGAQFPVEAAIASVEGVRERAHNKPSTPCPACGRDMECANGCQSQHRSGVVLM